jgi:hypothetical protein
LAPPLADPTTCSADPLCVLTGAGTTPPKLAAPLLTPAVDPAANPISALIAVFISNGANAAANCTGAACNGGNAGLLFGVGGNRRQRR